MPKSTDLEKTWIVASERNSTTFNAPSTLTIPYGRYQATVTGRGGSGNQPVAATYNTNYNTAFPIANQPIGTQPAATYNTNYNVAYPIGNRPVAQQYDVYQYHTLQAVMQNRYNFINAQYEGRTYIYPGGTYWDGCPGSSWSHSPGEWVFYDQYTCGYTGPRYAGTVTNYNTNYNVAYPIANRPAATYNTNYNTNYNTVYPIANRPVATYTPGNVGSPMTILGVSFPGGPIDTSQFAGPNGIAPTVSPTAVNYFNAPVHGNTSLTVPPGANVTVTFS